MSEKTYKEALIFKMRKYLAELGDPVYSSSMDGVAARSYARTTVRELIKRVTNSDDPPSMVISEFIKEMDRRSGMVFRVAYEISVDLYDHIFL